MTLHLAKRAAFVAILSIGALALAACAGSGGSGGSASSDGKSLVIVTAAQPASFAYEISATGYEAEEFFENTNATLLKNPYMKASGKTAPHQNVYAFEGLLAKSYTVSPDKLTYTFHLNTSATSVAGNKLTADDVIFTFQRKFKTSTSIVPFISAPQLTDPDTQIKKIDNSTVSFTVAKPGYGFTLLSLLSEPFMGIYDETALKPHETSSDPYAVKWSGTHFNYGFGAYKVTGYQPGQQMTYKANPEYVGGKPAVTTIVQRVVADPGQRANLVKSGDAQIATQLRPQDQKSMIDQKSAQVFNAPTNAFVYMPLTTTKAPFNDVKVRQALTFAIPWQKIAANVYQGRATPATGLLDPAAPGYSGTGLTPWAYDPSQAKSILKAAGYTSDVPFTITVNNTYPDLQETAVQIQTAADAAGFKVTIDPVNNATFQSGLAAKAFESSLGRDYAIVQSPPYELSLFYTAKSVINWPDWENKDFYAAVDAGNAAGDPRSAAAGVEWNKAQQIMQDQVPTIWGLHVQPLNAFANNVGGYVFRTDNVIDYSQLTLK